MKTHFGQYKPKYGQRWQVETVNSMIKRRLGSALHRKYQSQCRETVLRAITYNVMIVRIEVFYRALASPFPVRTIRRNDSRPLFLRSSGNSAPDDADQRANSAAGRSVASSDFCRHFTPFAGSPQAS